jgi:kinetochore-associated protein 1
LVQENFEVFLSFEDYSNSALVADLREQHIKAHEEAQAKHKPMSTPGPAATKGTGLSTRSKLHRQALDLQVSTQELEAELALRALRDGKVGAALNKCRWCPGPQLAWLVRK